MPPHPAPEQEAPTLPCALFAVEGRHAYARLDRLAVEAPLEIRLAGDFDPPGPTDAPRTLSLTMRTPGATPDADAELALGFLYTEGILRGPEELAAVDHPAENVVQVSLRRGVRIPWGRLGLERHFYTTSACGVCGKAGADALDSLAATPAEPLRPAAHGPRLDPAILHGLPAALRAGQAAFQHTGGLHAAGLFAADGRLLLLREDVGRHNAVDKLLGARLRPGGGDGGLPLHDHVLLVSGRASFELVQKARMASLPIFVAVGAPSSLAVSLAREAGMTLIGFARDDRCNVYSAPERLAVLPAAAAAPAPARS